jgi:para-aminobenzoate synthetase/4-amino-4-deoxychorismate lyase
MRQQHAVPAEVYTLVERTPGTVLLESASPAGAANGWTRLFTSPRSTLSVSTPDEVNALLRELESSIAAGFTAAGFLAYEAGSSFEPKAGLPLPAAGEPLAWFGIYERSYPFDHATGRFLEGEPPELAALRAELPSPAFEDVDRVEFTRAFSPEQYSKNIETIHEWIRSGDVYQLNFTVPLELRARSSFAALYQRLRARQPVAHGAFVHWQQGRRILSFSPELFFRLDEREGIRRRLLTRPMKGTAPRGRTTEEDRTQAEWLRNDEKNRAENLMIVDLVRNDLGRLARFGSVHVEELFAVERHPTLWQMTSTVTAELRADVGLAQIFRALFPCGSITGAPKVRAMQLLAGLEARPRGVYTGSIGFVAPGQAEFNVAIRTLEFKGDRGQMGVGGGIVIDSKSAEEYAECLLKARFLTQTTPEFQLIETLLWCGSYPLLALHLDRLTNSAAYFDFPCDRAEMEAALQSYEHSFPDESPRKVRLLLDRDGGLNITQELLLEDSGDARTARVRIAKERTDAADPFYFHKTTHRPLYAREFASARHDGFDEVLFFNQRGELTEGAISNVLVVKNGRWFTPPIACGLLAGVQRRHLLETRTEIEERVLSEDDLRTADAVYLANAVRGLRRAEIAPE